MNRLYFFFYMIGATLLSTHANAEQLAVEPKMSVEVGYTSGGNSEADRARLREHEDDFNLQLTMMEAEGDYTAGGLIKIISSSGEVLAQTVSEGPLFFAQLDPGDYTIEAEYQGNIQRRQVTIDGEKQTEITLKF